MSSWVGDWWERGVVSPRGNAGHYRTECKLGRHAIFQDTPAIWVTDATLAPMGLSCKPCIQAKAAELGRTVDLTERKAPKVPAPRKEKVLPPPEEWVHGDPSTYSNLKCRCVPCRKANSARSAKYRAARRERQGVTP